jgi:hypothetical protein
VPHLEQHLLLICNKKKSSSATAVPRKTILLHQKDGNSDLLRFNFKVPLLMVSISKIKLPTLEKYQDRWDCQAQRICSHKGREFSDKLDDNDLLRV